MFFRYCIVFVIIIYCPCVVSYTLSSFLYVVLAYCLCSVFPTALLLSVISGLSERLQQNSIQGNEINFLHGYHRACCTTSPRSEDGPRQCLAGGSLWNGKTESCSSRRSFMRSRVSRLNAHPSPS